MNLVELENLIKEVIVEEHDYQRLFKSMLDKSGKDINSMSDTDKKKFFNAVDKAYKAKSEGRLTGYDDTSEINEDVSLILGSLAAVILTKFVWFWLKQGLWKLTKMAFKEQDEFAVNYVFSKIENDSKFINDVKKIVLDAKDLDDDEAEKIVNLPIVTKAAKEAVKLGDDKFKNSNIVSLQTIKRNIKDILVSSWNNPKNINTIVNKIQADIK